MKCQRCKKDGQDRRTLWHACLYQMDELDVPFKIQWIQTSEDDFIDKRAFYTLQVCKECRGDWMRYIEKWFNVSNIVRK